VKESKNETKKIHMRKINGQSVTVRSINGTEGQGGRWQGLEE
jgi:hypothetical protein